MKKWQIAAIASLVIVVLFLADGGMYVVKDLLTRQAALTTATTTTPRLNLPPKAAFTCRTPTRTLKYIAPTDRDLIMFLNNSTDPDGDLLTSQWYVRYNGTGDWKLLNNSRDHWGRLPVSNEKGHEIKLVVSDGMKEESTSITLPVDLATKFPPRVGIRFKGMFYFVGFRFEGEYPPASELEMRESFEVIKTDLGCNAIKLVGDYEDVLVKAAEIAIEKGYEMIILSPKYWHKTAEEDYTIAEHLEKLILFCKRAEELRKKSSAIVLCVAEELHVGVRGITNASTYEEREREYNTMDQGVVVSKLIEHLLVIIREVRMHFHGRITYAHWGPTPYRFKYGELDLDIVAPALYWYERPPDVLSFNDRVALFRVPGRLFVSIEFGCHCWKGAMKESGSCWQYYKDQEYSQEEQAICIERTMEVYLSNNLDGAFLYLWMIRIPNDARSYGIVRYYGDDRLLTRKLGFYAYQSFTLS